MKTCGRCKVEFPKTLEYFYKSGTGLRSSCKPCCRLFNKKYYQENPEKVKATSKAYQAANKEKYKANSKAWRKANKEKKAETDKAYRAANKDKLREKNKIWQKENSEKVNAANKSYRDRNPEKVKAAYKAWALANPEKIKAKGKIYRDANADKEIKRTKAYRDSNRDKVRAAARLWAKNNPESGRSATNKRRALKLGNGHIPYTESEMLERYGTICYLCNEEIDLKASRSSGAPGYEKSLWREHVLAITNGGPDMLDNVKPSHAICNQLKGTKEHYENQTA